MYRISEAAKLNLERIIGLSVEKINHMSFEEQQQWVEKRAKSKLKYSKKRRRGIVGRGNPLLARRKIRTLEDLSKKSKKYIGM